VLLAALSNRNVLKSTVAASAAKAALRECTDNARFYKDLFEFNLGNREVVEKDYKYVCFHDLPPEVEKTIARGYRAMKDYSVAQIYKKLNLSCSTTNKSSPIETKWIYHYRTEYGSDQYSYKNTVDDAILLKPLTDAQYVEYQLMGF
jgi:hypothetical protein